MKKIYDVNALYYSLYAQITKGNIKDLDSWSRNNYFLIKGLPSSGLFRMHHNIWSYSFSKKIYGTP